MTSHRARIRAFLLLLILPLAVTACQKVKPLERSHEDKLADPEISRYAPGQRGGVFILSTLGDIITLNPLIVEDASSSEAIGMIQMGLTGYDPVLDKVIPGLAKSWEIGDDQLTFTFHLREGGRWSDGHPLTADDVIFSFQSYYDPRYPTRKKASLSVDGKPFEVTKLGIYTVRIKTPDIFAPFLEYVGAATILPKHKLQTAFDNGTLAKSWSINTAIKTPEEIVASGPYRIKSYRPGEQITFEANPYYMFFDKNGTRLPYYDYCIFRGYKDINSMTAADVSGNSDIFGIRADDVAWVRKAAPIYDFTVYERGPASSTSFIWFNQNPGKNKEGKPYIEPYKLKWFQSTKFRQAISYGLDRQGIIDGVFFGRAQPLWSYDSPANKKWYNPNVKQYPLNRGKARDLLLEAGFRYNAAGMLEDSEGHAVSFLLYTNQGNNIRTEIATIFKEDMKKLGIEVKLQFIDFGTFVSKISDSFDYECGLLGFTGGGDPHGSMSIIHSSGRLHQWYPRQKEPATPWEARMDLLIGKQLKTLDYQERKKYWDEIQLILSEQMPFIYLVTPNTYVGAQNKVRNLDIPESTSYGANWNLDTLWTVR